MKYYNYVGLSEAMQTVITDIEIIVRYVVLNRSISSVKPYVGQVNTPDYMNINMNQDTSAFSCYNTPVIIRKCIRAV